MRTGYPRESGSQVLVDRVFASHLDHLVDRVVRAVQVVAHLGGPLLDVLDGRQSVHLCPDVPGWDQVWWQGFR